MAASPAKDGHRGRRPAKHKPGDRMLDGSIYAGDSPDTGQPMYTTPADAPLTMHFNEATNYARNLDAHGHKDWRLPTANELNVLFNNRVAIGSFDQSGSYPSGRYWSNTPDGDWGLCAQRFSDGAQRYNAHADHSSVRCIRGH